MFSRFNVDHVHNFSSGDGNVIDIASFWLYTKLDKFKSAAVHKQSILSPLYSQLMRGDTCHTESCQCDADRLRPNIDEAKQKHKAFHTWLVELLKIESPVSIWTNDILVLTPWGTWGHSTNNTNTRTWEHYLHVQFTGSRSYTYLWQMFGELMSGILLRAK